MFSYRLVLCLGVFLGLASMQQAHAKTFVVTSTADTDGSSCGVGCTLRQAINAANKDRTDIDTIVFDKMAFATKKTITIMGSNDSGSSYNGLPWITGDINIIGPTTPGSGITLRATKDNSSLLRTSGLFERPINIDIANLTVTGAGTGLYNQGGRVNLTNCTFSHNSIGVYNFDERWIDSESRALVHITPSILNVNNSTFFSNDMYGVYNLSGSSSLNFCTVVCSSSGVIGGEGFLTISNSIVVSNKKYNIWNSEFCPLNKFGRNITEGELKDAGLDPRGLGDNGGPTETVALVRGDLAVGDGSARLAKDQRGVARSYSRGASIGAFAYQDKPSVQRS